MGMGKMFSRMLFTTAFFGIMVTTTAFAAGTGTVLGEDVNIHDAARTDAALVGKAHKSAQMLVTGKVGDWYQVSFDGNDAAYVSDEFLQISRAEGTVRGNGVNVRSGAGKNSPIMKTINDGDVVTVIGQNSGWYQLAFENGRAYVNKELLSGDLLSSLPQIQENSGVTVTIQNTYAIVEPMSGLNLRANSALNASVIEVLPYGEVLDVIEGGNEWIKVKGENGKMGYVSSEFVSLRTGEKPSRSISSSKGQQIVDYGKQFLGTPYVWGGTNLSTGVDCSGFVYAVMKNFGINLSRSSAGMANDGVAINKNELTTGDLILFDTTGSNDGGISHVGIYISNGNYIHCSSGKAYSVIISNLNEDYSARTYVMSRRVLR